MPAASEACGASALRCRQPGLSDRLAIIISAYNHRRSSVIIGTITLFPVNVSRKVAMHLRFILAFLLAVSAPLHARDYQAGKLHLEQPTARPTRPGQPGGAAYVTIENRGNTPDRLIGASAAIAGKTEIHTMTMEGGVMKMREAGEIMIAPGTTVVMQPGDGYHIMLLGLKKPLKTGEQFPLTLHFEKAGKVKVAVEVSDKIGGGPPRGHQGGGHPQAQ